MSLYKTSKPGFIKKVSEISNLHSQKKLNALVIVGGNPLYAESVDKNLADIFKSVETFYLGFMQPT